MFRFAASVVWVSFEPRKTKGTPQYRAGLGFHDPDPDIVEALCLRYRPLGRPETVQIGKPFRHQPEPDVSPTEPLPAAVAVVNEDVSIEDVSIEEEIGIEDVTLSKPSRHQPEPDVSPTEPPQMVVEADVGLKKSRKPSRRAASLRELPSGTPVVIKRRDGKEEVVVLVRVKQTRFLAKDPAGRSVDLAVRDFLRPQLENRPT